MKGFVTRDLINAFLNNISMAQNKFINKHKSIFLYKKDLHRQFGFTLGSRTSPLSSHGSHTLANETVLLSLRA